MIKSNDLDTPVAAIPPFGVRMQPELKRRLEEVARKNGRSLNSEIVSRLEKSLDEPIKGKTEKSFLMAEVETLRHQIRFQNTERQELEAKVYELDLRLRAIEGRP